MSSRVVGAGLALIAAALLAVSLATPAVLPAALSMFSGHPTIKDQTRKSQNVYVGLYSAELCNDGDGDATARGGERVCKSGNAQTGFRVVGYGELAATLVSMFSLISLGVLTLQHSDRRKGAARVVRIASIAAFVGLVGLIALRPFSEASIPIGVGLFLHAVALVAGVIASAIAVRPPPPIKLRVAPQHQSPQPPPIDMQALFGEDQMRPSEIRPEPRLDARRSRARISEPPPFGPEPTGDGGNTTGGHAPLFSSAPQLRPLYEATPMQGGTGGLLPMERPVVPTRPPTPVPRSSLDDNFAPPAGFAPPQGNGFPPPQGFAPSGFPPPPSSFPPPQGNGFPPGSFPPPQGNGSPPEPGFANPPLPFGARRSPTLPPPPARSQSFPTPEHEASRAMAPLESTREPANTEPSGIGFATVDTPLAPPPSPSANAAADEPSAPPFAAPMPPPLLPPTPMPMARPNLPLPMRSTRETQSPPPPPIRATRETQSPPPPPTRSTRETQAPRPARETQAPPRPSRPTQSPPLPRPVVPMPARPSGGTKPPPISVPPVKPLTSPPPRPPVPALPIPAIPAIHGLRAATDTDDAPIYDPATSSVPLDTPTAAVPLENSPLIALDGTSQTSLTDLPDDAGGTAPVALEPADELADAPVRVPDTAPEGEVLAASSGTLAAASSGALAAASSGNLAAASSGNLTAASSGALPVSFAVPSPSAVVRQATKLPISTAPDSLPPPKPEQEQSNGPSPACPQCEAPMAWVEEHLRFYCKSCRMYF